MAHWAEINEDNIVIRILVTDNNDPDGDEGYQWLVDTFGGRWIKASYNSIGGIHYLPDNQRDENGNRIPSGNNHLRYNYPGIGSIYDPIRDAFYSAKPEPMINLNGQTIDWVLDEQTCTWEPIIV